MSWQVPPGAFQAVLAGIEQAAPPSPGPLALQVAPANGVVDHTPLVLHMKEAVPALVPEAETERELPGVPTVDVVPEQNFEATSQVKL